MDSWGMPAIRPSQIPELKLRNRAVDALEAIIQEIRVFEENLGPDHEIGMPIIGGPSGLLIHIRTVRVIDDDKLTFNGFDSDSNPVRLVQHLSQLNFLMLAVKKLAEKPARIGFHVPSATED